MSVSADPLVAVAGVPGVRVESTEELVRHVVDGQDHVIDPHGMFGSRLDVETHVVTAGSSAMHNLIQCIEEAGCTDQELVEAMNVALVVGGSIAGMCAARALRSRFDKVTIMEQDGPAPPGQLLHEERHPVRSADDLVQHLGRCTRRCSNRLMHLAHRHGGAEIDHLCPDVRRLTLGRRLP